MSNLNNSRVQEAKRAILDYFLDRDTPPAGAVKQVSFAPLQARYRGGYFQQAFNQLIADGCIEMSELPGWVVLTDKGYEQARI